MGAVWHLPASRTKTGASATAFCPEPCIRVEKAVEIIAAKGNNAAHQTVAYILAAIANDARLEQYARRTDHVSNSLRESPDSEGGLSR
jgi:hypothetical protein